MNIDSVSQKDLNELERLVRELLAAMRKAKLQNEPLAEALQHFENTLGTTRRERFDTLNPDYRGY
jgi:hypothetical protein